MLCCVGVFVVVAFVVVLRVGVYVRAYVIMCVMDVCVCKALIIGFLASCPCN